MSRVPMLCSGLRTQSEISQLLEELYGSLGGLAQTEGEFVGDASYDQGEGEREGRTPSV